ncbi:MAG: DUF924 family protein [Microcoleaceae cyanobacterium]
MATSGEILNFWFGHPDDPAYGRERKVWFIKNPKFDAEIRERFLTDYQSASQGELNHWHNTPKSCLALVLLLDQFPRNLFRGQPQAFATDDQALALAKHALEWNFDQQLLVIQRIFFYMPFEHSENLADQARCVELFSQLDQNPETASFLDYAKRHRAVIRRFGRFPHRNRILGRENTSEEDEFLQQPGSSF